MILYLFPGCGDQALFDELSENRVKVIIKGTYESNNPRDWVYSFPEDGSVYVDPGAPDDENPTRFMLDIAGIKISSGKHNQYFANYRKIYSAGLNNTDPFFNDTGFKYENDDMRPDFLWHTLKIYFRKMIFNSAKIYEVSGFDSNEENTWDYDQDFKVIFHEKETYGLNFNLLQTITYCDYLKENYNNINRIFPLKIQFEDGFVFDYDGKETVMEIRLVIKNFIKKYEYEYDTSKGVHKLVHFYALSDWLRDIDRNEVAKGLMGGNLLAVARYYVPGKTATLTGTTSDGSARYVIAIKSSHDYSEYEVANRTRPACDEPKPPRAPLLPASPDTQDEHDYIEALLDYYLQYETYKDYYDNNFVPCVDSGAYATDWDDYNDGLNEFKIPSIVTCADSSGNYTLTNVPVGETYKIYESEQISGIPAGDLPSDYHSHRGNVTLTEDDIGQEITVIP